MNGTSQIPGNFWGKGQEEGDVIIRRNQLLCGIIGTDACRSWLTITR